MEDSISQLNKIKDGAGTKVPLPLEAIKVGAAKKKLVLNHILLYTICTGRGYYVKGHPPKNTKRANQKNKMGFAYRTQNAGDRARVFLRWEGSKRLFRKRCNLL